MGGRQAKIHNNRVRNGSRAFQAQSRCWPGGTPGQLLFVAEPVYFIQKPDEVWMIWQRNEQVRRIYLNREHSAEPKPSWFGESVGRYGNGQLVIDTIAFIEHPLSFVDNYRTPHTKGLHVAERWRIVDGGTICAENNLNYERFFKLNEYPMPEAKAPDF
jgi:hypothetical protein